MPELLSTLILAPPLVLLSVAFISDRFANRHVRVMRPFATTTLLGAMVCAVCASILLTQSGTFDAVLIAWNGPLPINLGVYFDSLAAIMTLLITFVGWVIARYSVRYLDGGSDPGTIHAVDHGNPWRGVADGGFAKPGHARGSLDANELFFAQAPDSLSGSALGHLGRAEKISHQSAWRHGAPRGDDLDLLLLR